MKGIILEGVTGSGKTRIFGHLQRMLTAERPSNTKIFLSEHYTERVLEHQRESGTLTPAVVLDHLQRMIGMLESLRSAKAASKFSGRGGNATVLVVVERFLLGQVALMSTSDPSSWRVSPPLVDAIAALYRRIDACGLRTIVLRVLPDAMRDRVLSTRRYRNAAWCDYLASLGDDDAIVARYTAVQNTMLEHSRSLEAIVQPTFTEIGADWEDDQYEAVADDLKCRFLKP